MTNIKAIKTFFEADGGKKIEMAECKALSKEERNELGAMCCEALGAAHEPTV